MSVIREIYEWSKGIPAWQSDAIARLVSKQTLDDADYEDLFALLKSAHGIPDPKKRTPSPLKEQQIPVPTPASSTVRLLAVRNLCNVNAIAENRALPIGGSGLTVIYGDNGSGKSGYSRVLKRACRARDQKEVIRPNARKSRSAAGLAEATFEIDVDGATSEVRWIDGKSAPEQLSALAIFDSHCARAILDKEDDFSYVPYGLDILLSLAQAFAILKQKIQQEIKQTVVDKSAFITLEGETEVGRLISDLSHKTKPEVVTKLSELTEDERSRYEHLDKTLKTSDPKERAKQIRAQAARLSTVAKNVSSKAVLVGHNEVKKLREMLSTLKAAKEVADLAVARFTDKETLLPGTGADVWQELFETARRFAMESYPNRSIAELQESDRCPLCQEPLRGGADRLRKFDEFVAQESEKKVKDAREALKREYKQFVDATTDVGFDQVTHGELEGLDKDLAKDTRDFQQACAARKESIKNAVTTNNWTDLESDIANPAERLRSLVGKLEKDASDLDEASDEAARKRMQFEYDELTARLQLAKLKEPVISAISRLVHEQKLEKCLKAVKTNAISIKTSEIAEKVVSNDLADALNEEYRQLGVGNLNVSLESRADRGKALHKLKLKLSQNVNPMDILSEGEQRAVALGSFLAEINVGGGNEGIIFDDPVSSLDHRRRERVARRLVSEAAKRQVIILTHDVYFLCILEEEAKAQGVPILTQSLQQTHEGFGVPEKSVPFEAKSTKSRIGELRAQHQVIEKLFKSGDEKSYRQQTVDAYGKLRMTWERAVEEVLFRNTVIRFRKGIETMRLAGVIVEDGDFSRVYAGMKKCSNYTGHDKAQIGGASLPDPDDLLSDIEEIESWRKVVDDRSNEAEKRRKAAV